MAVISRILLILSSLLWMVQGDDTADSCVPGGLSDAPCQLPPLTFVTATTVTGQECNKLFVSYQFLVPPKILWSGADTNTIYTFAFVGTGPILHAMVNNIPGNVFLTDGDISKYTVNADYLPPIPPPLVPTVYQALIFRQTRPIPSDPTLNLRRLLFNMEIYSKQNELCGPLAGLQVYVRQGV